MAETKIALVTGANKGIGKEIARQLLASGITVLIGSRNPERGRAAAEELRARTVELDVTDQRTVDAAAKLVEQEYGRLDILVNNAGITAERGTRPTEMSADVVRRVYDTNVFGLVRVTNAFVPLLRRAASPRVVNVTSELGSITMAADPTAPFAEVNSLAYNSSKSALNAITVSYAKELREAGIKVNAVSPGFCATDLNDHRGYLDPADGAAVVVRFALTGEEISGEFHGADGRRPW